MMRSGCISLPNPRSHLVGFLVEEHPLPDWCRPGEYQCNFDLGAWKYCSLIGKAKIDSIAISVFLVILVESETSRLVAAEILKALDIVLLLAPYPYEDIKWKPVQYLRSPELPKWCQLLPQLPPSWYHSCKYEKHSRESARWKPDACWENQHSSLDIAKCGID